MGYSGKKWNPQNPNNHSVKHLNRMARDYQPGNYYVARELERAMWANTFRKSGEITSDFDEETKIELIRYEKKYWSEFFVFWDNNKNKEHKGLEYAKPYIIDALYQNSGVGVIMVGDSALVYRLAMFWRNAFYEITRATGIIYSYPTDYDAQLPNYSLMNRFDLTNGNCAMEISDPYAVPWGFGIESWAVRRKNRYAALDINLLNSMNVKLIESSNLSANALREIEMTQGGSKPWHVIDGTIDKIYNTALENGSAQIWNDYGQLFKDFCRMRGLRFNLDAKVERNTSGEIGNNDTAFIVEESWKRRTLTDLCEKINFLFGNQGINVSIKSVLEMYDLKKAMIEGIPSMLAQEVRADGEIEKQKISNERGFE